MTHMLSHHHTNAYMPQPPNGMPLSQWLMQDLPSSTTTANNIPAPVLPSIDMPTPSSAGLPTIVPLGPQPTDFCSADDLATRQYCMLAARATINDWTNLATDFKHYILHYPDHTYLPTHYKKALEALLCCHIFAGIPRCIEGLYTVRNAEREHFKPITQLQSLPTRAPSQQRQLQRLTQLKSVIDASQPVNDASEYIQTSIKPSCQCKCADCKCAADVHSSAIRQQRGDIVLKAVYRDTYDVLRKNLSREHANLWRYIQENVYGVQLARNVLTIQEIECVAVSALIGMQCERQVLSHMRGAKLNGVKYELLLNIVHDLRLVYAPAVIEDAIKTLNRIYKVKPVTDEEQDLLDEMSEEDERQLLTQADRLADKTVDRMYTIEPKAGHTRDAPGSVEAEDADAKAGLAKLASMRTMMAGINERMDETEKTDKIAQLSSKL